MTPDSATPATATGPLRVCFVVRSLDVGGAERQLVELVRGMPAAEFDWTLLTFYGGGPLERELEGLPNVRVRCLQKGGRWDLVLFARRLLREVRRADPHVVHGVLGVANEAALLAGRMLGKPVLWWLGAATVHFDMYDWALPAIFRMGGLLSRRPDAIVVNSCAGYEFHRTHGWSSSRMTVIANGFDVERFQRDREAGLRQRREWGVAEDEVLVGIAARLDPVKDHDTFLAAAARLAPRHRALRFVCIGDGPPEYRAGLHQRATALGLDDRLIWAGESTRMRDAYNSLDIACLTSVGEGLPNVVGEAMCCEVPCVVTDVGDCATVVGDTGLVVPVKDPARLAEAIETLATVPVAERRDRGRLARARIVERYSRQRYIEATSALLRGAAVARISPSEFSAIRERLRLAQCG